MGRTRWVWGVGVWGSIRVIPTTTYLLPTVWCMGGVLPSAIDMGGVVCWYQSDTTTYLLPIVWCGV